MTAKRISVEFALGPAMKLYVINLERAPERMTRIGGLLDGLGVDFERVEAVDGRTLPPPPADASPDAWALTSSEIGLIRSHQKCWALFEQSGDPHCVILEDDVHFGSDFALFMKGGAVLPEEFDLIKIETTPFKVWLDKYTARSVIGNRKLMRLASSHIGAAGYVLSRAGLEKVHRLIRKFNQHPIDVVLFGPPAKALTIYQLTPSLVIQDNALKNASPHHVGFAQSVDRGRKPRVRGMKKVLREIARPFQPYWPPGPLSQKWRLRYGKVGFE
jgi:glycosyl transferase family 25